MSARARPAAWRARYGECPGVVEISRRAGIFSGKGDAGKGGSGGVGHSIAWGIVLKLYRDGLIRKCAKSPGRSGYEPTELAAVRMRGMPQRFLGSASPGVVGVAWSFLGSVGPGAAVSGSAAWRRDTWGQQAPASLACVPPVFSSSLVTVNVVRQIHHTAGCISHVLAHT